MHAEATERRTFARDDGLGRAIAWAVGLHLLIVLLLLVSPYLDWSRDRASAAGAPLLEATLEVSGDDRRALERALAQEPEPLPEPLPVPEEEEVAPPPPQPLPEPEPEPVQPQPVPQEQVPDPAPVDQEEVRRDAEAERARIAREQEERRRQEQIELAERQKREREEAERKRRLAEQQLAQIRAERERIEHERRQAEQRLQQLADREARQASQQAAQQSARTGAPAAGNQGADTDLLARYSAALQQAIQRNWTRPDSVPLGQKCRIVIRQIPGGEVIDAKVDPSCPYDELGRRSVEAAVLKAQPLPYAGFEAVFQRTLILNFEARDR